jgi:crotonobetainyl-CoA:carnitine CoA-transferase CaiB-like acyl-CoA transferase
MLPLAGLRIIAVEQYGAGPFGSMMLADLGAEVIKIENPAEGGDVSRRWARISSRRRQPLLSGLQPQQEEPDAQLKHPQARRVLHALVRTADATSTTCAATSRRSCASPTPT